MRTYVRPCQILQQEFSLGTRPHKSRIRTHNYVSTSAENGLAMGGPARLVPAPMMSSVVPRLLPSFLSLAVRTANDGKLMGPVEQGKWFQIPQMRILMQCYIFVSEICTMMGSHFPRQLGLLVLIRTTSCVFKVHICTFSLWKNSRAKTRPAWPLATAMRVVLCTYACITYTHTLTSTSWLLDKAILLALATWNGCTTLKELPSGL